MRLEFGIDDPVGIGIVIEIGNEMETE